MTKNKYSNYSVHFVQWGINKSYLVVKTPYFISLMTSKEDIWVPRLKIY